MSDIVPDDKTCEQAKRFDKPTTSFLELPPEIRQKIYAYNLCFERKIDPFAPKKGYPWNPPTPGLLRVNKKIYHEAVDMLYSKNIFHFTKSHHVVAFETKIGLENCKRVREISICIPFPTEEKARLKRKYWPPPEYDDFLCPWIAALAACRFNKIVHLRIDAFIVYPYGDDMLFMPKDLQEAIEKFFLERLAEDRVPRLSLSGFRMGERKKFPENWKVVMKEWDYYRHVIRKLVFKGPEEYFVDSKKEGNVDDGEDTS